MRTPTASMNTYLNQNRSTQPILVAGVDWNGLEVFYSDSELDGAKARLVDASQIYDMLKVVGSGGSAKSISISLEDSGGDLKEIMDSFDFHMRSCNIYLVFNGLSLEDKLLLFSGNIVTPIEWDAAARSLTFSVMTDLDSKDAGFIMEEGAFPDLPDDADTAWPICFGQVCRMEPVLVRSPLQGTLVDEEGIMDPSLLTRICQAKELQCSVVQVATANTNTTSPEASASHYWHQSANEEDEVPLYAPDSSCVQKRYNEICDLLEELERQRGYHHDTIEIANGIKFPSGIIDLVIEDGELSGHFSGNTFHITDRHHPEYDTLGTQECVNIPGDSLTYEDIPRTHPKPENMGDPYPDTIDWANYFQSNNESFNTDAYYEDNVSIKLPRDYDCSPTDNEPSLTVSGGSAESWEVYNALESGDVYIMRAGSKVFLKGDDTYIYIVSLTTGTVLSVAAYKYRKESDEKYLTEIPSDYYEIVETDYGEYTATEVHLTRKLSDIDDSWQDDKIAVSFVSDIGPNPAEVIEWLIEKYSDYTIDESSFNTAKNYLDNYPCNFVLRGKQDLLGLINDIAYQARSEVKIKNGVVYMSYLAVGPNPVMTINDSLVYFQSSENLKLGLTDSDDLITNYKVKWSPAEVPIKSNNNTEYTLSLKHNVGTYGLHKEEFNYYTLTTLSTILKTATFWLIRKANSWKTVSLTGPLPLLQLEVDDCVLLDLPELSSSTVKGIVQNTSFNPKDNSVELELWTPLKCGETEEYYWTWPASKPAVSVFPLPGEDAGPAYAFEVVVPEDHLLSTSDDVTILSNGDPHPSDIGDEFPSINCYQPITDLSQIDYTEKALEVANESYVRSLQPRIPNIIAYQEALSELPDPPEQRNTSLGSFPYTFTIDVQSVVPDTVSVNGVTKTVGEGDFASGTAYSKTHFFVNKAAAEAYRTTTLQSVENTSAYSRFQVGVESPTSVSDLEYMTNEDFEDPGSIDETTNYYSGEVTKPRTN